MKNILTITFMLLSSILWGQTVVTTTGSCSMRETGGDYQRACDIALERAKALAVSDVCGEDVSVFSLSKVCGEKTSFTTKYNISSYGVVRVISKDEVKRHNRVSVTITGEVYDVSGPRYLDVSGMLNVYNMDQNIAFDVKFNNPCYLKVFWLDNQTGTGGILYDGSRKFNTSPYPVRFPDACDCVNYKKVICPFLKTNDEIMRDWCVNHVYYGTPKSTGEDKYVTVVFVATNSNVPYVENYVNEENFLRWWCSLPCDERAGLERKSFIIKL